MDTDQSGSPRKTVLKKRRLLARAFLSASTNDDSGDTDRKIVRRPEDQARVSIESEGSKDSEASSQKVNSAFLDGLEGQSQATYADGALVDSEQAASQDSNPLWMGRLR